MRYVSAREMMNVFHISRTTLNRWKIDGCINYQQLSSRKILYDIDSVNKKSNINNNTNKKTVLYFRITPENKSEVNSIIKNANNYATTHNFSIEDVYIDIITHRSKVRPEFKRLIDDIHNYDISCVCVLNEHNMSYSDFEYFEKMFSFFETNIVVLNVR